MTELEERAMRIDTHPILGEAQWGNKITLMVDGEAVEAYEGEPIATALLAAGRRVFRHTTKRDEPRGVFCALGRCTDCVMVVDGRPNVRTCVTLARDGMVIESQSGLGHWGAETTQSQEKE
jgi:predicted molibdopterin-dependent oxidoreductase YjgC